MKKISIWFSEVADPELKKKLQANLDPNWADKEVDSLDQAILSGFYWTSSPEGFAFWDGVTNWKYTPEEV